MRSATGLLEIRPFRIANLHVPLSGFKWLRIDAPDAPAASISAISSAIRSGVNWLTSRCPNLGNNHILSEPW